MSSSSAPSKPSCARKILLTFGICIAILFLFAASLPSILSTSWGKEKVVALINDKIPGKIDANQLQLRWFGPQEMQGVNLKDPSDSTVISVQHILVDKSLFNLAWSPTITGSFEVNALDAFIATDANGTTNLEKALQNSCCNIVPSTLQTSVPAAISLRNVHAKFNEFTLQINGETQQNGLAGQFSIDAELKGVSPEDLLQYEGDWQAFTSLHPEAALKANADITNFPLVLLDQLIILNSPHLGGIVTQAFGQQLNMSIKQKVSQEGIALDLRLNSANLEASGVALISNSIVQATFNGKAIQEGQPTTVHLDMTMPKPSSKNDVAKSISQGTFKGSIVQLPLKIADSWLDMKGLLTTGLGNKADMKFEIQPYDEKLQAAIQVNTDRLNIGNLKLLIDDKIELQQTATLDILLSPHLLATLMPNLAPMQFRQDTEVKAVLHQFSMPLSSLEDSGLTSKLKQLSLKADFALASAAIDNLPVIDNAYLNNLTVNLIADPKARSHITVNGILSQPSNTNLLSSLLGSHTSINASSNFSFSSNQLQIGNFNLKINSELARVELAGDVVDGRRLRLTAPAIIDYTLSTAGLQSMGIASDNYIFNHKSPIRMTVASTHIPLSLQDISQLYLKGDLIVNDLTLNHKTGTTPLASIDDLTARWIVDGANRSIVLDFTGATKLEQQAAGKLNGGISIENWIKDGKIDFHQAKLLVNSRIQKLPTAILGAITGRNELLLLIGNSIDIGINGRFSLNSQELGNVIVTLQSPHIEGNAALTLDKSIHLYDNETAEVTFKLTPQGYTALRNWINPIHAGEFSLTEPSQANLKITNLDVPLKGSSFLNSAISFDLQIDRLTGFDKKRQALYLRDIRGTISSKNLSEKIAFNMTAQGSSGKGDAAQWNMVGSIDNGLTAEGSLNRQTLSLAVDGNVENLPVPMLCQLICRPGLGRQIETVIGPVLNATIKARLQRMNGPLYLDIKGSNGNILVDSQLYEGVLTLNKDLKAQVVITPQLGQYIFQEYIPIMDGILSADQPMRLTIDKRGFSLPLRDLTTSTVSIGQATLELGNVKFSNRSQLAKVLTLLTPANADQIQVWLTPAYISLNNGIVKLERLDLLVNERYPLATWGTVDMEHDKVNMMFGLSGTAIAKAFNVTGIPHDYMLQVPLRGTTSNASVDRTKAAARLSALVAQSQGGPQGLVIGTVLDIATGGMTEPKIPAPTTNPLPWSSIMAESDTASSQQEKHKSSSPIEEIGKGAGTLLKKLFK